MAVPVSRSLPHPAPDVLARVALGIVAAYLAVAAIPLVRYCVDASALLPAVLHLAALGMALAGLWWRPLRRVTAWIPLLLGPFLYIELRWIIAGAGMPHADAIVASWEAVLFPSNPSRSLANPSQPLLMSEVLHLCYLSYYVIVYAVPAWVARRRDDALGFTALAIVLAYAICFITFVVFPVDGPRYLHGPASTPDGPLRDAARSILERGSSRGTAFPSAHVAASLTAALCALRYARSMGIIVLVVVAGMAVGAVFGGYHYGVDVVAGVVTALAGVAGALGVQRAVAARRAAA